MMILRIIIWAGIYAAIGLMVSISTLDDKLGGINDLYRTERKARREDPEPGSH